MVTVPGHFAPVSAKTCRRDKMEYDFRETAEKLPDLLGKVLVSVCRDNECGDELVMLANDGTEFLFYHEQRCYERVEINDICGDLDDLVGSPITQAEESVSEDRPADAPPDEYPAYSETWTFYKFATIKGSVTVRWFGSSNGYYSESVNLKVTLPKTNS
jgi:hypothetical protein